MWFINSYFSFIHTCDISLSLSQRNYANSMLLGTSPDFVSFQLSLEDVSFLKTSV